MKQRGFNFTAFGFVLVIFLIAAAPVRAEGLDDRIKAIESELSQLKEEQIELKKEATAAAAALPNFSYRPGNGLFIEAADKSWGVRFSVETHLRMLFENGQDAVGRTNGEIMLRRHRPYFFYCINNCLWEWETAIDMDGFGTGNAKNSTNTATGSIMQRGALHFHAENVNPWLPTVDMGGDISTSISTARQGSSAVGSQMEYDLITRNYGPDDGRAGQGFLFNWDDRSLAGIGIPGRIGRFQIAIANILEGDDNLSSFKDRKSFNTYISLEPFSQLKNKWIRGLQLEWGTWICNVDDRPQADNGCGRFRIQDDGNAARQPLFDTGANSVGRGSHYLYVPGFSWEIGPYRLRAMGAWVHADSGLRTGNPRTTAFAGRKEANGWLIGHDLFVWSPKGFLTGSPTTTGSILLGTHFHRANMECTGCPATINAGQFHRIRVLRREASIHYFMLPRMSIGAVYQWWDASNLTTTVQQNLDIRRTGIPGKGGQWYNGALEWRYQF